MVEKSDLLISQFQNLLNYCPSVIFSFNYQDCLKINFISENLKAILGYKPSKFISIQIPIIVASLLWELIGILKSIVKGIHGC